MDTLTDHVVPGRLTDYSSTLNAIVAGCFNVRVDWTDVNGQARSLTNQGAIKDLWLYSSGGPTRDGRSPLTPTYGGIDIVTRAATLSRRIAPRAIGVTARCSRST